MNRQAAEEKEAVTTFAVRPAKNLLIFSGLMGGAADPHPMPRASSSIRTKESGHTAYIEHPFAFLFGSHPQNISVVIFNCLTPNSTESDSTDK